MTANEGHLEATKQAEMIERRQRVWQLFARERRTHVQIAKIVGVAPKTVCLDIWKGAAEYRQQMMADVGEWLPVMVARIEADDRQLLPILYGQIDGQIRVVGRGKQRRVVQIPPDPVRVAALQVAARDALTRSSKRLSMLLGTDAPTKIAPVTPDGMRPYREAYSTDEALAQRLAELTQRLGLKLPVIDVAPSDNGGEPVKRPPAALPPVEAADDPEEDGE